MPIVSQSVSASYSHFSGAQLLLSAPHIAGLLPASTASRPPEPVAFVYSNPRVAELPAAQRDRLYVAAHTLLDVTVIHALGEMNDHALNTAMALFRRAVMGQPMQPMNPAQFNAEMDAPLLEWAMNRTHSGTTLTREVRRA